MSITYASPDDLQRLCLNLSFLSGVTQSERESALEAASDLIDSYLASQFTLPLKKWGQDIVRCNCCIARYDLAVRRGYNPEAGADVNIRTMYEDCIRWLERIADGDATPSVIDSSSGGAGTAFVITSSQRGFSSRGTETEPGPFEGD